ncbi:hypothetical protein CIB95_09105 [Lottiidibacillus patelloidae]|uniref:DinB-like domain-containing protein n=1 Tax=Lottiidibacillus patelloidae TaxID=2670334 RepID=A0A263BTM8_9BACI|nr:DinB family protein [Lottiidibacillus patelloidae]OZM56918.1 hypothetical protein CIB95_09105 [Lottiidibacillus patelloidae]
MEETMLFQQLDFYRHLTLSLLDSIEEEKINEVPAGYKNSVLWNAGHIYVSTEFMVIRQTGEELNIPDGYRDLFSGGTKPADWTVEPPSINEIKSLLKEQPERIKTSLKGKTSNDLLYPFEIPNLIKLTTIGEVLNFALYHEGQHTGFMKGLKNAINK